MKHFRASALAISALLLALSPMQTQGEAMLQYFNTDWNEIALKMPEPVSRRLNCRDSYAPRTRLSARLT